MLSPLRGFVEFLFGFSFPELGQFRTQPRDLGFGSPSPLFSRRRQPFARIVIQNGESLPVLFNAKPETRGLGEESSLTIRLDSPISPVLTQPITGEQEKTLRGRSGRVEDQVLRHSGPPVDLHLLLVVIPAHFGVESRDDLDDESGSCPFLQDIEASAIRVILPADSRN